MWLNYGWLFEKHRRGLININVIEQFDKAIHEISSFKGA
jgi:hypothetical protein